MNFWAHLELAQTLPGDIVELGVGGGETLMEIFAKYRNKQCWGYDTFNGFPNDTLWDGENRGFVDGIGGPAKKEGLVAGLEYYGIKCVCGVFPQTFWKARPEKVCFVHADLDTYLGTISGLELFAPFMVSGGAFLIHDYGNPNLPGVNKAVGEFLAKHGDEYEKDDNTLGDYCALKKK